MFKKITDRELVKELLSRLGITETDKPRYNDSVYKRNGIDISLLDVVTIEGLPSKKTDKITFDCYFDGEVAIAFNGDEIKRVVFISIP